MNILLATLAYDPALALAGQLRWSRTMPVSCSAWASCDGVLY